MLLPEGEKKHTTIRRIIIGQQDISMSSFEHGLQEALSLIGADARKEFRRGAFRHGLRVFHFVLESVEEVS